jgi:hypothetical protein
VVAFQVEDGSGADHLVLDRLVVGNGQGHREQRGDDLLMVFIFRRWFSWRLLNLARMVYPSKTTQRVWQIIEVPRRLSEQEADDLAAQVVNL